MSLEFAIMLKNYVKESSETVRADRQREDGNERMRGHFHLLTTLLITESPKERYLVSQALTSNLN